MTEQKDSGNDMPDVDVTDSDFQDRTFGTDVMMPFGSLNYESQPFSLTRHQGLECTCGAKSYAPRSRKPGRYTAGKKHVNSSSSFLPFIPACISVFSLFYHKSIH